MKKFYSFLLLFCICISSQAGSFTRQMEYLDRGLVAVKITTGVFLSWRILGTDNKNIQFHIYRDDTLIATLDGLSNYQDRVGRIKNTYRIEAVVNGQVVDSSKEVTPWEQQYLTVQLNRPEGGITPPNIFHNGKSNDSIVEYPDGQEYTYTPNDISVADLDGDGEYEIIVKWDPSNSRDNSETGITGNVYIDAYKLDGTMLWRIDLGKNIRAGAHYTQFMVYDLDGDGKAEVVMKTAPGTIDGKGNYVLMDGDDPEADYRNLAISARSVPITGFILNGPEYLTLFDGLTGEELHTIPYKPGRGTVSSWGDNYGNRVDRFLACIAYLDGVHPSVVMCRGYYTRATLAAYDVKDKKLVERWFYDSGTTASKNNAYGQGNHSLAVGDVDGDGYDEIIYGGAAINHDGTLLYNTQTGHGDAGHLSDMDPDRPGLEYFQPHEEKTSSHGYEFRDAGTGEILWGKRTGDDNGRGLAADIDPNHPGFEAWSSSVNGIFNCKGEIISDKKPGSTNFRIYWDGDLLDELLDKNVISKWDPASKKTNTLFTMSGCSSNNSTKATPNISADIFGDWREEVILWETNDPGKLRIYTTTIPTEHGLYTLMHDPVYRLSVAWQNVAYNQPPHLGVYIGNGIKDLPYPDIYLVKHNGENIYSIDGPDLSGNCKIYADKERNIQIESPDNITSVIIYSIDGRILYQDKNIRSTNHIISLSGNDKICIVRVGTNSGIKTSKIVR